MAMTGKQMAEAIRKMSENHQTISPSSERIIDASEAIKNGWSQAEWVLQTKYNAAIRFQQSQNLQATRQRELASQPQLVAAQASNQIAASKEIEPQVGDVYEWTDGGVYELFSTPNPLMFGMKLISVSGGYAKSYMSDKIGHVLKNSKEWIASCIKANNGKIRKINVCFAAIVSLPFKRHPMCEEKAVHMTAQMCLGCEKKMRAENDLIDPPDFFEDDQVPSDEKLNESMPSGVISGYGGIVGGSWNGRAPR